MDGRIAQVLAGFDAISLEALNEKAAMLERLDNKYIVSADRLLPAFERFEEHFDVLEIGEKRSFVYATEYFDDDDARSYNDHHQGRRKRCKVRIRNYVDAGFSYLEVKLKDLRDATVKKRMKLKPSHAGLCEEARSFVDHCHVDMYGTPLDRNLRPVIAMQYVRTTLVAREGGERMTIDTGLIFENEQVSRHVGNQHFIIETKSARGNGIADKILRKEHLHPTKQCSKYCVGMAALGSVKRHNRFLPAMRKLGVLEQPLLARQSNPMAA